MIRGGDDDDVARETVDLEQKRAHDTFDLARFVLVPTFFAEGIKLVEKEHTVTGSSEVEKAIQTRRGFTEITRHHRLVSHHEERHHQVVCQSFGEACLAVAGRAGEEDSMTRLEVVAPEQITTVLFFNDFANRLFDRAREDEIVE